MADSTPDLLESEAQQLFVDSAVVYGLAALTAYEYALTFRREITTIWPKSRRSGPAWLFIINRYLLVVATVLTCAPYPSARICSSMIRLGQTVGIAQYVVFAVFNALRVYAFSNSNLPCGMLLLALGLVPVATNIYVLCLTTPLFYDDPLFGGFCTANITISPDLYFRLLMTTRAAVIAGDAIVLVMTWTKTWHTYKIASRVNMQVPLSYLILRDGTIYFVILLALNVLQILVVGVSLFEKLEPVNEFIVTLTPILISRFLLNLRDATQSQGISTDAVYDSQVSIPGFRVPTTGMGTLADNMGAMLDHDQDSLSIEFGGEMEENNDNTISSGDPKAIKPPTTSVECPHIVEEELRDIQGA